MKILVTGTPGVGKTTCSRAIAAELAIPHIDVTQYIKDHALHDEYDSTFDTLIFDERKVRKHLKATLASLASYIIDTHSPVVCRGVKFDFIFQLRCNTKVLAERLLERKYSEIKITENLDCECLDVVGEEVDETFGTGPIYVNGCDIPDEDTEMGASDLVNMLKSSRGTFK